MAAPTRTATPAERVDAVVLLVALAVCGTLTLATLVPAFAPARASIGATATFLGLAVLVYAGTRIARGRWSLTMKGPR